MPPAMSRALAGALPQSEPGWKPLVLPADVVNEALEGAAFFKDGDLTACMIPFKLESGVPVVEIGTSTPADREFTSYILQQQDADHYIEIREPVLLKNIWISEKQLLYRNRTFRQRPIATSRRHAWERAPSGTLLSGDPLVVGLDRRLKKPIYQIPDGTVLGVNEFNPVIDVVYQNMPYGFHPQTRFQDGWYYSASIYIENAIRFRPRTESSYQEAAFPEQQLDSQDNPALFKTGDTYEVEPFSPETNLFPLHSPVYLRDEGGRIWETLAQDTNAGLFIARHHPPYKHGNEEVHPEYGAFNVNGDRLVRMNLEDGARILGLRTYADPESTWLSLEKYDASKINIPTTFSRVSVDIASLLVGGASPRAIGRFKEYAANFDGHVIKIRIGKRYSTKDLLTEILNVARGKNIDILRRALPAIPKALLRNIHTITVVDAAKADAIRGEEPEVTGIHNRGGHVALVSPNYSKANLHMATQIILHEATRTILHEAAHALTSNTDLAYSRRVEAAVALAVQSDGKAGYRNYAEENWEESLAVGFEAFEKAGPAMQQLILNLMLNPDWQP